MPLGYIPPPNKLILAANVPYFNRSKPRFLKKICPAHAYRMDTIVHNNRWAIAVNIKGDGGELSVLKSIYHCCRRLMAQNSPHIVHTS